MVMFKMEEESGMKVEDGEYIGEITNVLETNGKYGPCARFIFTIVGGDYDSIQVAALVPNKLYPGSRLDAILRGLGVEPLDVGTQLDSDALSGKRARIWVEQQLNKKDGKMYSNVTRVKSLKTSKVTAPSAVHQGVVTTAAPNTVTTPGTGVVEVPAIPAPQTGVVVAAAPVKQETKVTETKTLDF
jgi:hypothetical protein